MMSKPPARRRVRWLIAESGGVAVATVLSGGLGYVIGGLQVGVYALIATGAVALTVTRATPGAIAGLLAAIGAFVFCGGLVAVIGGAIGSGLGAIVLSGGLGIFSSRLFWQEVKRLEQQQDSNQDSQGN